MKTPATKPPAAGEAAKVLPIRFQLVARPRGEKGLDNGYRVMLFSGATVIGEIMGLEGVLRTDDKANASREEIAAFIVTACNSYVSLKAKADRCAELEGALQDMVSRTEEQVKAFEAHGRPVNAEYLKKYRALLTQSKGVQS